MELLHEFHQIQRRSLHLSSVLLWRRRKGTWHGLSSYRPGFWFVQMEKLLASRRYLLELHWKQ